MARGEELLTNQMVADAEADLLVDRIHHDELLVISFAFVSWDGKPAFDFFGRLKKLEYRYSRPVNRILLRDRHSAWYHRGVFEVGNDVDEVAATLKDLIRTIRPSRIVTIGQSMGGYASLMFGGLVGADKAIAFGPLSFINAQLALLYNDRRWLTTMEALEDTPPPVEYFDLVSLYRERGFKTRMEIFFGTKPDGGNAETVNLDAVHASRLGALPTCSLFPYPEANHLVSQYLIDQKLINDMLYRHITSA